VTVRDNKISFSVMIKVELKNAVRSDDMVSECVNDLGLGG